MSEIVSAYLGLKEELLKRTNTQTANEILMHTSINTLSNSLRWGFSKILPIKPPLYANGAKINSTGNLVSIDFAIQRSASVRGMMKIYDFLKGKGYNPKMDSRYLYGKKDGVGMKVDSLMYWTVTLNVEEKSELKPEDAKIVEELREIL